MPRRPRPGERKSGRGPQRKECGRCGRDLEPEEVGKNSNCEKCRISNTVTRRRRTERLIAEGACIYCSAKLADDPYRKVLWEGATRCSRCLFRQVANDHLGDPELGWIVQRIFDLQRGCCAITGKPLILHFNASLDHRIPTTRGGDIGPENLWWVTKLANFAKTNMTPDEHAEFSEAVVAYHYSPDYTAMVRRLKRAALDGWQTSD